MVCAWSGQVVGVALVLVVAVIWVAASFVVSKLEDEHINAFLLASFPFRCSLWSAGLCHVHVVGTVASKHSGLLSCKLSWRYTRILPQHRTGGNVRRGSCSHMHSDDIFRCCARVRVCTVCHACVCVCVPCVSYVYMLCVDLRSQFSGP